jgi:hypothetical protein
MADPGVFASGVNRLQQHSQFRYCPALVTLSSRGLGHRPFTAVTRVRIPLGSLFSLSKACATNKRVPFPSP